MTINTVVIACVTTETVMVSAPIIHFEADEVHLFRYIRDPGSAKAKLYEDHYVQTRNQISASLPMCRVIVHTDEPVYEFARMVRKLEELYLSLRRQYPEAKIYANLSSGTSEFIAALGVLSFLNPGLTLFKVPTENYTLTEDQYYALFYDNGIPVGLSRSVYPPKGIVSVDADKPDENLVRCLRVYSDLLDKGKKPHYSLMRKELEARGLWKYEPRPVSGNRTDEIVRMREFFSRSIAGEWKRLGWIEDECMRSCPPLTNKGRAVIEMFYTDTDYRMMRE